MSSPTYFGRYRVLEVIAHGQMGTVYLAEDPAIGRKVAIKSVRADASRSEAEVQRLHGRFRREIQIAGTFSHPNIATLYDVGEQDGITFIAMELVDGESLGARLEEHGRLTVDEVVALVEPIADALRYAHERGVVHRDIKPSNILLTPDGVPKIVDFGLARLAGSRLTQTGNIVGAPAYMSPEQAAGEALSGASDQFSLAVMTYEMLSGRLPFLAESPAATVYRVLHEEPLPLDLDPRVPPAVCEVVMRGLSKDAAARHPSCRAFAVALRRAASAAPAQAGVAAGSSLTGSAKARMRSLAGVFGPIAVRASRWWHAMASWASRQRSATAARRLLRKAERGARELARRAAARPGVAAAAAILIVVLIGSTWAIGGSTRGRSSPPADPRGTDGAVGGALPAPSASRRAPVVPEDGTGAAELDAPVPGGDTANVAGASGAADGSHDDAGAIEAAGLEAGGLVDRPTVFTVVSRPAGARVTFDDAVVSETPTTVEVVPGRRHELRLERQGYRPLVWRFTADDLGPRHLESGELYFLLDSVAVDGDWDLVSGQPRPVEAVEDPVTEPAERTDPVERAGPPPAAAPAPVDPTTVRRLRAPSDVPVPDELEGSEPLVRPEDVVPGVVLVEVEINAQGQVIRARVVRSLAPALDRAALDAVIRRRYAPTQVGGKPVHVTMTVSVPFGTI